MKTKYTKQMIEDALIDSYSMKDSLNKLGLKPSGGNYTFIKKLIVIYSIDNPVFKKRKHIQNSLFITKEMLISKYLIQISTIKSVKLKNKLIAFGMMDRICNRCAITSWNNIELAMELHHINRDNMDCRLDNLEILCPNCHTIEHMSPNIPKYNESSLKRVNKKHIPLLDIECKFCNKVFHQRASTTKYCSKKCHSASSEKIYWPSNEELKSMLWKNSTVKVAKELGVSDSAIGRRCKKFGIDKPPRGYWVKLRKNKP